MKRKSLIQIVFLLAFMPIKMDAKTVEVNGITYELIQENHSAILIDGTSITSGEVIIPESVTYEGEDYSVDNIRLNAFYGCEILTSVFIPSSVYHIDSTPFGKCQNLVSLVVDENNRTYDSRNGCNAIIDRRTNELIQGCKATIIPDGVTSIEFEAFSGCNGLTSITIPNSVTEIAQAAFDTCI